MDTSKLQRGEYLAMAGGLLLAVALFLTWYSTDSTLAKLGSEKGPFELTGFDVHTTMRYLLLAAAAAPFILAWIILRDHKLSWPRGEMTAVVAIAAFGLVLYNGVIAKPGSPREAISLEYGWFVAVAGTLVMLAGAASRSNSVERKRKPPGTI